MQLFILRVVALSVLVALYEWNPNLGIAALACGFGYVVGQRFPAKQPSIVLGVPPEA